MLLFKEIVYIVGPGSWAHSFKVPAWAHTGHKLAVIYIFVKPNVC